MNLPSPMSEELIQLRELAAKQPRLEMVLGALDELDDAVIIADPAMTITYANRKARLVFRYGETELVGQKVHMLVPLPIQEPHVGYTAKFWDNPTMRPMGAGKKLTGRRKDGTEFPCEIKLSPYSTGAEQYVSAQIRVL